MALKTQGDGSLTTTYLQVPPEAPTLHIDPGNQERTALRAAPGDTERALADGHLLARPRREPQRVLAGGRVARVSRRGGRVPGAP